MLTLRLIRREARTAWPVAVVLALLAVLLTAIPLSWPPRFDRLAAGSLADRIDRAQLSGALVTASSTTVPIPAGARPGAHGTLDDDLDRIGAALRATAGPPLAAALGRPQGRVATASALAAGPGAPAPHGGPQRFGLVHAQPDATDGPVEFVQGRAPRQASPGSADDPAEDRAPIEVAVSEATRQRFDLTVGQTFGLTDLQWATPVVLVGVFRTDRGATRLWQQFPMLVAPWTVPAETGQEVDGQMLTSAEGIVLAASRGTAPLRVTWDLPVAIDRAGPAATPAAIAALRSALAGLRAADAAQRCVDDAMTNCLVAGQLAPRVVVTDRLTPELEAFAAQRGRTGQLQGFALAGLLGVAVATAFAAARLGARRRGGAIALQLSRGAGRAGIAGRLLAEGAVAVGAGLATGWAAGRALAPPGAALGSPVPVLAAAVPVWCAPAAAALVPPGRAPLRRSRRFVLEALVLLSAGGGLAALRARGAFTGSGIDLQLALTPVLLALALILVLLRLLPPALLRATRWARRSRGLVPLVALARAGAQSGATALALLVLVLATGYGVFGGTVSRTLADGRAQTAEWYTGGAPTALVGPRDRLPEDLSQVPGVAHQVTVTGATGELTSQDDGTTIPAAGLVGVDATALDTAAPSSPLARALLAADDADTPVGRGGASGTEPLLTALADPGLASRFPDGTFEVSALGMDRVLVHVVAALPDDALRDPVLGPVLGTGPRPTALLLFTGPSQRLLPARTGRPSALLLYPAAGGPPIDRTAVRTASAPQLAPTGVPGQRVELRDRAEELDALRADGLVRSVRLAFQATAGLGLLLALGAFALELLLSASERARTMSYLRTLGTGGRSLLGLHLLHHVPLLVAAAASGTVLGLLLPGALGPGLHLAALTGGPFEPATHTDWTTTAALGVAVSVLMLSAAALEVAIGRRRGPGAVLRLGEAL
ncbi:hypothetical protein AB0C76_39510 [Kitasatospora sp. NPDC048722]|uniref:hypothetical protein n=1 Tax=Kitasatospora sp. NPDC048722 TaxID=3155639 RepID=UPI003408CA2C